MLFLELFSSEGNSGFIIFIKNCVGSKYFYCVPLLRGESLAEGREGCVVKFLLFVIRFFKFYYIMLNSS